MSADVGAIRRLAATRASTLRDVVDYNDKARTAVEPLLAPGETFLAGIAVDRGGLLASSFGVVGLLLSGAVRSKGALPFATSNVAVLTDRRLVVLPRRGRSVGAKPRGEVALSDIASMRVGKFGRRPLLFITPRGGKEQRLMTVSSDPEPFVTAFQSR